MKVDGRCHCGAIVYEAEVEPGTVGVCHCSDCQQLTGSPFRANIQAPAAGFRILQGDPCRYVKHGDSGAARVMGVVPIGLAARASAVKVGNPNKAKEERLMDVINAIHSRRSIRSYQSNLVDRDLIDSVIWDAAQAPPPFSGQVPWTFNVIEGVARIAALITRSGATGFHPGSTTIAAGG